MDEFIDGLPPGVGYGFNGALMKVLAFADSIILLNETPIGMERLVKVTTCQEVFQYVARHHKKRR